MPSTSVVVPAYNGAAFIREALESVFAQTLPPREIIVVDDASTDRTPEIVAAIAATAPVPVRLLRLDQNSGGPGQPINVGIGHASGEFVAVLDQDDLFLPSKLEDQAARLAQDPDLAFVFSLCARSGRPETAMLEPSEVDEVWDAGEKEGDYCRLAGPQALRLFLKRGQFVKGYPGFLFRRTDWQRKGGCDSKLLIASDYDLLCWLCTRGAVGFVRRIHYLRREHDANLCKRRSAMSMDIVRVKTRYLARHRWLLQEDDLSRELHDEVLGQSYWARNQGHYADALRCHWMAARVWGWDRRTVLAAAKLLPHWVHRQLTSLSPWAVTAADPAHLSEIRGPKSEVRGGAAPTSDF